ncbi:ERCC4 domain nuclease [Spraguea lophii 42_110]|uniref:Crossover junction endonuclease MUS81 n=1 Tax=Spraguea lophii (strain 42_110) TaxID=1358809 RepID=S7W649_SPRLO|nr:ERCC4 domain nuclease [Spraguea lophii 42_110]
MKESSEIINAVKHLLNIAKRNNSKTKYNLQKLYNYLVSTDKTITIENLKTLKNVGEKTVEKIKCVLNSKNDNTKQLIVNENYIPSYRSGAYAILKCLYLEEGLTKLEITQRGAKYTDADFQAQRYNAWSSMATLLKNGIVFKEKNPLKFYLTDKGKELSEKLFSNDSINETVVDEILLIVDSREMKNRRERDYFQENLKIKDIGVETRSLPLGDFLWIKKENNEEYILPYIIERKCGDDFCSSITDGRLKEQKRRLKNTKFKIFYIIENLKKSQINKIGVEYTKKMITSLKLENINVLETTSITETMELISLIDKKIKMDIFNEDNLMRYSEFNHNFVKTGKCTIEDVFYRSLLAIRGLSSFKAKCIAEKYKTIQNFYKKWKEEELKKELFQLQIKDNFLGDKWADKIIHYYFY